MTTQNEAIPAPARVAALEKIPAAARRMGVSISSVYRELKAGRLAGPLVKTGARASAIPAEAVDRWIAERIAEASRRKAEQEGAIDARG